MRKLKFGIELEVATSKSRREVIEALSEAGINVEGSHYGSAVRTDVWKVQPDGSIKGWEIVSPPSTDTEELKVVCHVLRKVLKAKGSPKCGVHIHHDINDFNIEQIKNIYKIYNKYERNAIRSIMRKQRYNNYYARPIDMVMNLVQQAETTMDFENLGVSRYHTLNNRAYVKYGTIEFRHHHGTTDINEVLSWLELTHKIVEAAEEGNISDLPLQAETYEESLEEMFEEINLTDNKIQRLLRNRRRAIEKMDGRNQRIS